MKSFKQYLSERRLTNHKTGTFMDYNIRKASKQIPTDHIWLDIIRTPEETSKNQGGATSLVDKLKIFAINRQLPIYLDPIGPKAREFFLNRGFKNLPETKLMYWGIRNDNI